MDVAAECIRTLRGQPGQRSYEFKASHLIRAKGAAGLAGFLGPSGPIYGRARVPLTHKFCFVLSRVLDLFIGGSADTASLGLRPDRRVAGLAVGLCRDGPDTFGRERWHLFLAAANGVLRVDRHRRVREPVDAFLGQVELLRSLDGGGRIGRILDELSIGRRDAYSA